MSRAIPVPALAIAVGVPPTLMIVTGHSTIAAVTLGLVLAAWVTLTRIEVRARQKEDAQVLDFAQTSTNLGGDPSPVITALRQRSLRLVPDPRLPAEDEDDFDPRLDDDPERPWVYLRQRDDW